ncbi:esterase/lipase family protein [Tahibacter soli]|uniref:Alpha/beta hydrolase n=1 Tax=Tahibacter soli TaxID=2983605 RepID=A0A9X3YPW6_9GAMM|nr:alpha/beta hydrolase [Tahibacter soli]MDC8015799.1 alpha/beta hydrolase [Tahibacter soli]
MSVAAVTAERVILLHGVWMRGFSLLALRRRLEAAGYATDLFEYASVVGGPEPGIERLLKRMRAAQAPQVHLVGHSLGGLVALQAIRQGGGDLPPGKIVCLGSPLKGSGAARGVAKLPGGSYLLGRSLDILRNGLERWDGARPVGVVAGSLPIGLGRVIGGLTPPHDGTVSVDETRLDGIADHCEVPVTHTGLLFSAAVAQQAAAFLRDGRFAAQI